jgi:lipopolysaccharide transport system ATP-binding protein
MSDSVIKVENVSKAYRLGQIGGGTLKEDVSRWWAKLRGKPDPNLKIGEEHHARKMGEQFWALDDVSFEVKEGEVLGIIGRNGAGKSTLLKILSQVTTPTSGEIKIKGRIASLLEVGTGFHPELTGRENIFLNGAILGMTKAEIRKKFDEIVTFSGVEEFIDTPVKRYSSGMYVRLAFAVAAHLEPEILIVDEVLAVGDASFQKKCLGKIQDVNSHGRTVLFVSHSMPTIVRLCKRVVLLHDGTITGDGLAEDMTRKYLSSGANSAAERIWSNPENAPGDKVARLRAIRVINHKGQITETIDISEPFEIEVEYWNLQDAVKPTVSLQFNNEDNVLLFCSNDFSNHDWWATQRKPGLVRTRCRVPANLLTEGRLFILGAVCSYDPDTIHALERDAISFQAVDRHDLEKTREKYSKTWPGVLRPRLEWRIEEISS